MQLIDMIVNKNASKTIKWKNHHVFPNRPEASMEIPIISANPNFVHFLQPIEQYFTNPQYRNLTHYLLGLLLCEGKRTVAHMSQAQSHRESYNRLHHFLSESPWNENNVNEKRISQIRHHIEALAEERKSPVGFLIGDDTTNPKTGKKMAGFDLHYSTTEDAMIPSQSVVATLYHFEGTDIPLYGELYKTKNYCAHHGESFRTKNDFMVEQIRNFQLPAGIRTIGLFDAWYFNAIIRKVCHDKGIEAIGRLNSNRRALLYSTDSIGTRLSDWFHTLRTRSKHPFRIFTTHDRQGHKRQLWIFHWTGFIANLGLIQLVMLSSRIRGKEVNPVFIASTDLNLSAEEIIDFYFKRWAIETFFWTVKERMGFNHYQVRTERSAKRHWLLCFLAYSYLSSTRPHPGRGKRKTLGECQRSEQRENFRFLISQIHSKIKEHSYSSCAIYREFAA